MAGNGGERTHRRVIARLAPWLCAALLQQAACAGRALPPQPTPASPQETAEALAVLRNMSSTLASLQRFQVTADVAYDVLQPSGQLLEFGSRRRLAVERPDRMRVEVRHREGSLETLVFDGNVLAVSVPDVNRFARVERPGSVEDAVAYLVDDLGLPAPLLQLLRSDLQQTVASRAEYGLVVGPAMIDDVLCDHLWFRADAVDFEIWIGRLRSLPVRLVVRYRDEASQPEMHAVLGAWRLDAPLSPALFRFVPPEGAEERSLEQLAGELL